MYQSKFVHERPVKFEVKMSEVDEENPFEVHVVDEAGGSREVFFMKREELEELCAEIIRVLNLHDREIINKRLR